MKALLNIFFLLVVAWIVAACAEEQDKEPRRCCAKVRFYHAAPNYAEADVFAEYYNEQQRIVKGMTYGGSFPANQYLSVETTDEPDENGLGTYIARLEAPLSDEIEESAPNLKAVLERQFYFDRFESYSIWFADSGAGRPYWRVTRDSFDLAVQDTATVFIRFLNLNSPTPLRLVARNTRFSAPGERSYILPPAATDIYGFRPGQNVFEVRTPEELTLDTLALTLAEKTDYYFYYDGRELRSSIVR